MERIVLDKPSAAQLVHHALVGRPNGTRALIRKVIRDSFLNKAMSSHDAGSTAPAAFLPSGKSTPSADSAGVNASHGEWHHHEKKNGERKNDSTGHGVRGGEEGFFSYDCDLAPTLQAGRPRDGVIEEACAAMLRDGEKEKLLLMRDRLKRDLASVDWLPDVHGDVRLPRFLRQCKGDCASAVEWYRGMLAWRRREGVDKIRDKLVNDKLEPGEFPYHAQLQALMPVTLWSERPRRHVDAVQVIYNGKWKTRGLVEAIRAGELTEAQFLLYWVSSLREWNQRGVDECVCV